MSDSTFGAKLRQLREAAALTQTQLAEKAGLHRQGIAKLEMGEREPTWATVQALAAALGLDCTAFQSTEPPPAKGKATTPPQAPPRGKGAGKGGKGAGKGRGRQRKGE